MDACPSIYLRNSDFYIGIFSIELERLAETKSSFTRSESLSEKTQRGTQSVVNKWLSHSHFMPIFESYSFLQRHFGLLVLFQRNIFEGSGENLT
jgi:hypothetical protein